MASRCRAAPFLLLMQKHRICTYLHAYIHVHVHAYIHVHVHAYIHTHTCTCIYMYMYIHIHVYTCTCTCMSRCTKSKGKIEIQEVHEQRSNARSNVRFQKESREVQKISSSSLNISHRIQIIPLATSIPSISCFSRTLTKCHFFLFGPASYREGLSIT